MPQRCGQRLTSDDVDRIVQIIPGGGWKVTYRVDGRNDRTPVVAWGLTASGTVVPLDVCPNGDISVATQLANFVVLDPPT